MAIDDGLTLEQKQAMLAALRKARYSGVRILSHAGTTTEYKSDAEMAAAEAALVADIQALSGTRSSGVSVSSFDAD